ncbi:MAG: energy-coupling factor transporter transmembrane component T family protein, partial [Bacillota bacterium]
MAKSKVRFGSYYPGNSVIHRLDPRAKLIGLIVYIVAVFAADSYTLFALLYLFGGAVIAASRVPLSKVLKSIRGVLILLILTGVLNIFFTPGETVLWEWGFLTVTWEGLNKGILMVLRLVGLIAFSAILTLTTTPILLADGVESLCRPLKRFKFPVHEFAMMMTIALRFIPILMEEADKIMKAQRSRGGDLSSGSLGQRLKG